MSGRKTLTDDDSAAGAPGRRPAVVLIASGGRPLVRVLPATGTVALGRELALPSGPLDLGDERASRDHAQVRRAADGWRVTDRGSHNGTFVDGRRVDGETAAEDGAVLRVGASLFWLVDDGGEHRDDGVVDDGAVVAGPRSRHTLAAVRHGAAAPSLLLLGESGTGKEALARSYHRFGPRSGGPFVAVNCAAIPALIAERVLFGSRRGAFSGAEDAAGYVQAADGGTLFLDEVGELSLELQAKLLRVLEQREVWPVGATRGVPVELGVVAATHRNLRAAVAAGQFREDLYYRIAKPAVHVRPLRERRDEIPALAARTLAGIDAGLTLHPRLLEALCTRPWPGNVRELLREVAAAGAAAVAARQQVVRLEHLAGDAGLPLGGPEPDPAMPAAPDLDRNRIVAALAAAGGNVSAAARALGLHRTQLYRLLDRHGIERQG